jgi:hypothetical protein
MGRELDDEGLADSIDELLINLARYGALLGELSGSLRSDKPSSAPENRRPGTGL